MSTIFLVIESGGEYEDAWSTNHSAWLTREAAEAESVRIDAENKAKNKALVELYNWYTQYHKDNAVMLESKLKEYPRWMPGLGENQITPAMRAEREAIVRENAEISRRAVDHAKKWNDEHLPVVNAKRVELGLEPKDTMYDATNCWCRYENTKFEIQELVLNER